MLRFFVSSDLYLHEWDERFHAVVAKNILSHPLKPTLYDNPVLAYDYKDWSSNHIWLSKPPLPIWLLGVSISLFGNNEIGVRLPSILLSMLCVLLTFKTGVVLFGRRIGLVAAFLHAIHGATLELSGGIVSSDHVDIAFLTCSQLCLLLVIFYIKKQQLKYLLATGIILGFAYLCKWIMAFLLILMILPILFLRKKPLQAFSKLTIIIGIFIVVALPWQLFILHKYPQEAMWMFKQMFSPIVNESQVHKGNILFYVDWIRMMFGELIYLPLLWLTYKCLFQNSIKLKRTNLWIILVWIFVPILFLSISVTKRHTYLIIAAPAIYILTAFFLYYLFKIRLYFKKISIKLIYLTMFLLVALPIRYSIERIKPFKNRYEYPEWRVRMEQLQKNTASQKIILSNEPYYLNAMFYFDFIAYRFELSDKQIKNLNNLGYIVYENKHTYYMKR